MESWIRAWTLGSVSVPNAVQQVFTDLEAQHNTHLLVNSSVHHKSWHNVTVTPKSVLVSEGSHNKIPQTRYLLTLI